MKNTVENGSKKGVERKNTGARNTIVAAMAALGFLVGAEDARGGQIDASEAKAKLAQFAALNRTNAAVHRSNAAEARARIKQNNRESDESAARMRILVEEMKRKHGIK